MDSLLERIEENKLDALYLFINETLRDRQTFDLFVQNLVSVLPQNWSIQRVEVGHEFLSMIPGDNQDDLFELICGLESLRTLIISDGYVPRKDNGSVQAEALLSSLPRARNLLNLDLQRLHLSDAVQVQMLESAFESLGESLEEIRITGLVVDMALLKEVQKGDSDADTNGNANTNGTGNGNHTDSSNENEYEHGNGNDNTEDLQHEMPSGVLDGAFEQCIDMANLRSLTISQKLQSLKPSEHVKSIVSQKCLTEICQNSTTLQDLCLRSMNLDDPTCLTLSYALKTNSFLTSLDLRQNARITNVGYASILHALERNYDLWCSVMVDDDSFQARFNSLIELNQANRGDLIRSPSRDKLVTFIATLNQQSSDATSLWYFLSIHDTILFPLTEFLKWKSKEKRIDTNNDDNNNINPLVINKEQEITPIIERGGISHDERSLSAINAKRPRSDNDHLSAFISKSSRI